MKLLLKDNLPFATVTLAFKGKSVEISNILIDTGSASTILATDSVAPVQITPSAEDVLHTIRGVGGTEVVFIRKVDFLQVGKRRIEDFHIEIGGMDYGFDINGILGMDFLTKAGAIINLREMRMDFSE